MDIIFDKTFLKTLKLLNIVTRKVFTGQGQGLRRTFSKGTSIEFSDYRKYVEGDDLRFIDWNLYARLDKVFIKLFHNEENLNVYIMVDSSRSMAFGTPSKIDYAKKLAAAISYIALVKFDRVQIIDFANGIKNRLKPVEGPKKVIKAFEQISEIKPSGRTNLLRAVEELFKHRLKSGVIYIISDFMEKRVDYYERFERALKLLIYHGFEVNFIQVLLDEEANPLKRGNFKFVDSESGESMEITVSQDVINKYMELLNEWMDFLTKTAKKVRANFIKTTTQIPFENILLTHFSRKKI